MIEAEKSKGQKETKTKKNNKQGQGEGSIYKRKDGRWAAVLNLGYQNGKLRRKSFYGKTRGEVREKLTTALNDVQKGLSIASDRQTLGQFLDRWLTDCVKPSVRPSTYVSYEQQVRVHLSPNLGQIQLSKLNPQHIQAYMNKRLSTGLSPRTVRYHRLILQMALGQALKWSLLPRNVATLIDPPRVEKYEVQPITREQAKAFLLAIEGDRMEPLFTVALALGLRRGEALGLRWSDVDFQTKTLRINQALQRPTNLDRTKSIRG